VTCILEDVLELYLKEHKKSLYHSTNHNAKSRTVCSQQRENDEDITSSDMTILVTFDSKVKQFFIMSICNTFDELMLHHDVCSI
jgi:predicted nucleotidyltransferase